MPFSSSLSQDRQEVFYNARIKHYPDGSEEILVCDAPIFHGGGWERSGWKKRKTKLQGSTHKEEKNECSTDRAVRRARAQVRDIALCTPFQYFVTLTLDNSKVNRYDMVEITRKLNQWLDNQVRRKGLCYVLVPELHKDGAVHFHGFFNGAVGAVDSGHTDRQGHTVYNLPGWTLGFTTAISMYGDYHKAVGYVCKYIGKQQGCRIGGRWYYSGGELGRPGVELCNLNLRDVMEQEGSYPFAVEAAGLSFALLRLEGSDPKNFKILPCKFMGLK